MGGALYRLLWNLKQFNQPRARETLRAVLLTDPNPVWRFRAAVLLADHREPLALEELLGATTSVSVQAGKGLGDALESAFRQVAR